MMKHLAAFVCGFMILVFSIPAFSQQVTYSQPLKKDDYRHTEFEIIGKLKVEPATDDPYDSHILVYKNTEGDQKIAVYSPDMKLIGNVQLRFITDGLLGVDFLAFPDHFLMVYQYQEGDFVYCKGLLMDGRGKVLKEPVLIDSSEVGRKRIKSRIYTLLHSDNRNRILIYKINQDKDYDNIFYTFSYDEDLNFLFNSRLTLPMQNKHAFLAGFSLTNDGHFVFVKEGRPTKNSNINEAFLVTKAPMADTFSVVSLPLQGHFLEELKLRVDNKNNRVFLGSFFTNSRRGNVAGLYAGHFNLEDQKFYDLKFLPFGENLRREASQRGSINNSFDNYFIRKLVVRGDGGFLITAEDYYSTSRNNDWNRWNPLYSPWGFSPYYYSPYYSPYSYSPFSPWYYSPYGFNNNRGVNYHYLDVAILSYDSTGKLIWSNFIRKNQQDDDNASFLSYKMINIGSALLFIYNSPFRRSFLLTAMSVTPDGKLSKLPTLRGLDNGYQWMPRYGRQIGARTVVVPCIYRNYICFAKIVF